MPTQYNGLPANVESNLPTVKTITNITAATPIVVTTSTNHGLSVGDYFAIPTADDANAVGTWKAGTVTGTTVVLLIPPGGGNSTGGAGGSTGTLQPYDFGPTYAIPSGGDKPNAASVNVAFEALGDRTAWLLYLLSPKFNFVSIQTGVIILSNDATVVEINSAVDKTKLLYQHLLLPDGATVSQIDFRIAPAAHASIAGLTLPTITFTKINATSGSNTTIATASDTSANAAAYSIAHDLTLSGLSEVIDRQTYLYRVAIETETTGVNALDGTVVLTSRVTLATVDNQTD